jgi:hypothetical protein
LRGGEDGVILLSFHPNMSYSLEDNDASSFAWPSLYLHTLLRCMETKTRTWRCQKIWEDLKKVNKTFIHSIGAKRSKIVNKISSKVEILKRDGVKLVLDVK